MKNNEKTSVAEEELYLAPQPNEIANAEAIAFAADHTPRNAYEIFCARSDKELLLTEIARVGGEIEETNTESGAVLVKLTGEQLAAVKTLPCVERVQVYDAASPLDAEIPASAEAAAFAMPRSASVTDANSNAGYTRETAIDLSLNNWQSGTIDYPYSEKWYRFVANAPEAHLNGSNAKYVIYTEGSLNTVGMLYDAYCNAIEYNEDNENDDTNFFITSLLTYGETYYICVRAQEYNTGSFNICVSYPDPCFMNKITNAVSLPLNKWKSATIVCPDDEHWYKLEYGTGAYTIKSRGAVDTVGFLYDETGALYAVNNNGGENTNFKLITYMSFQYPVYLCVKTNGYSVGDYSIWATNEVYVETVSLNKTDLTMTKGDETDLQATTAPINATYPLLRWTSSDKNVATVDQNGHVIAKNGGCASICAVAQDGSGCYACCTVTVNQTIHNPVEEEPEDKTGNGTIADPIDAYSGAHVINNTVLKLFGGQALSFKAHYNSTRLLNSSLGIGWYHNYEKRLLLGECEALVYNTPSSYIKLAMTNDVNVFNSVTPGKKGYVLTVDECAELPYCLNCNYERTEYYDWQGRLSKIVSHTGFVTRITYTNTTVKITDTLTNKSIYLEKDANGRIIKVHDNISRQATFTYSDGYLVNFCDVNGNNLSYTYDENGRIDSGVDAKNIRYFENTYDAYGRVISQMDAVGCTPTIMGYGENGIRRVCNRNEDTAVRYFDENGLLIKHVDENSIVKTYSYDAEFNVTKTVDGNGNCEKAVYNKFNKPTAITDKNGNTITLSYDSSGNVTKIRYPENNGVIPEETFVYDSQNRLLRHINLRGTATVYTYDTNGLPLTKKVGDKNAVQYVYENGFLKSETDANGNTTQYTYNSIGQLVSKTDAQNHTTAYTYDACGNVLKITDANGKSIVTTYDCNHQKTSVSDANGNKTNYSYNGNMKNESVTLPDGNTIRYEYDPEDRLVRTTDQAGNVTITNYDKGGRVISKQFPDGGTVTYEYDKSGNVLKETNQKGAVTIRTYDAKGNVLTVTDPDGNVTRCQYDKMSRVIRKFNAAAGATLYTYSNAGDLLCEIDALGNRKTFTYDAYGNRLTVTDALGNVTAYTYDQNNNLLTATDALGNVTTYTYNCSNQPVTVRNAKGQTVTYGYDALGRKVTTTDAKGNVFTIVYDANGNVTKVIDAKGNAVSETTYNALNLPVTVTNSLGTTVTYTYNSIGKVASKTDELMNRQEYLYNARGQNTQVRDALDHLSNATYDVLGNPTRLSGPLGGATNYTYDDMGRTVSESTVSGGTVRYGYNALNLKEERINAKGQSRKYFYDAMGRIAGYVGAEDSVAYTYDANGNVLTVTDKNGTIKRTYDALNRVSSCTDTYGNTIIYMYDTVGQLEHLCYPDGTVVTYEHDANGNLVKVTDWANRVTNYTYDENNRVIGVSKPDGSITTTQYDSHQRITSHVEKTSSGAVITGFEYIYDSLGRISEEKVLAKNTKFCYTYDDLSRVTCRTVKTLSGTVLSQESYSYDAAGNIVGTSSDSFLSYDTNNRLTYYNNYPVTYDSDGNMLSFCLDCNAVPFEYDSANRLVKAGGHEYVYNAEDVRIRNRCGEYDTTYVYNTNCKMSQLLLKTTNGVETKYLYGRGLIGEEKQDGFFKTYHFDYRGSTVALTDESGNITDTFAYDTYGKLLEHTGDSFVIFGYNGRDGVVTDKNGLIYMRARYYSPDMKRFINADIIPGKLSNAITLNRFAYANGNPVSFVDPFGLWSLKGAWNSFTNWVEKEIVDPIATWVQEEIVVPVVTWVQTEIKNVENNFLKNESLYFDYNTVFDNHEHNLKNDIVDTIIDNQRSSDVGKLKIGKESMSNAGCEVIAVYNAKIMLGEKNVSLANTIEQFENNGALIAQPFSSGYLGSNPYAIGRVLDAEGLKYSTIDSFEQMQSTPGVYIVSVWNSNKIDSKIHTVAIEVLQGNDIIMKNGDLVMDSTTEDIFITGYKISRK